MSNPIDPDYLRHAISSIIPPEHCYYFDCIDSTNQFLKSNSMPPTESLSCCIADQQTAGRGRFGKTWISPQGVNLYFSLGMTLSSSQDLSGIGLIIALSIVKSLSKWMPKNILFVKWPNDIISEHRKLSGILIERHGKKVIIGIGVNVNTRFEQEAYVDKPRGSILELTGQVTDRNHLLIDLIHGLHHDLKRFLKLGLSDFMTEWTCFDYLFNKKIKMSIQGCEKIGYSRGITESGLLIFEDLEGKRHHLTSGDASLLNYL